MKVEDIKLKIIPDSRGKDTLEVTLKSGSLEASASVPSGKSIGATEVTVLPPSQAVDKISWLISQLKDHEFVSLEQFDELLITLDGTKNKSSLGGNLILSLSMAFARLLSKTGNLELFELISSISGASQTTSGEVKMPFCFFNLIEGGVHVDSILSRGKSDFPAVEGLPSNLPFQEYLLIPQTNSPKESLEIVMKTIKLLEAKIQKEYGEIRYGDEGGFAVPSDDPLQGLRILQNFEGKLGLDVAASAFYQNGDYQVGDKKMTTDELLSYYQLLTTNYQLLSIEDPFDEGDWQGFSKATAQIGDKVWIIGDDLLTTNVERMKKAYGEKAVNAVLIKPNQIGTITETIQAVNLAKSYGWKTVVSHRSGETMDTFIADLAVGVRADGLKSGCPLQKERLVKYQRLVEIEKTWHI